MARLNLNQCRNVVFFYFLREGWLPADTAPEVWGDVTMEEMEFDNPPLPSDHNFQKRKISLDLQFIFFNLGSQLGDSMEALADGEITLAELATWCHQHQG